MVARSCVGCTGFSAGDEACSSDFAVHNAPADAAREKAEAEYERYRKIIDSQPRVVDADFEQAVKKLPKPKKRKKGDPE